VNARESVPLAQRAEIFGHQRIWVGDSHMIWRKLYALLAAIADMTARRRRLTRRKF
jgi:alkanesulfonate monooxygenase SsuD/methylene tetrahydromethanopterin reductase-like flavin-dependent oxidoreductase (luciferase family)